MLASQGDTPYLPARIVTRAINHILERTESIDSRTTGNITRRNRMIIQKNINQKLLTTVRRGRWSGKCLYTWESKRRKLNYKRRFRIFFLINFHNHLKGCPFFLCIIYVAVILNVYRDAAAALVTCCSLFLLNTSHEESRVHRSNIQYSGIFLFPSQSNRRAVFQFS